MHGWESWQWSYYTLVNWLIALAYFVIPFKQGHEDLSEYRASRRAEKAQNKLLFRVFVFTCGVHHLVHPPLMYLDHETPRFVYWVILATMDSIVAAVSLLSAKRIRF